jgi:hypothetical protein
MKMYAYLILAVLVAALLLQPLTEIVLVFRDKIVINSAINNSVRAAQKESFTYEDMRDAKTGINESTFINEFEDLFEDALDITCTRSTGSSLHFTSYTEALGDFDVDFDFDYYTSGGRDYAKVNVYVETDYKFKTRMLSQAQQTIENTVGALKLTHDRDYTLIIVN